MEQTVYNPQKGRQENSVPIRSVSLPVAVSTSVVKFGNFNCR